MIEREKSDHYATLEIEVQTHISGIDQSTIKKAYRKLALMYHPDKRPKDSGDIVFKTVSRAYEILSNEKSKRDYDSWYCKYYKRTNVSIALIEKERSRKLKLEQTEIQRIVKEKEHLERIGKEEEEKKLKAEQRRKREEEVLRKRREEEAKKQAEKLRREEEKRKEEAKRLIEKEKLRIRNLEQERLRREATAKLNAEIKRKEELKERAQELNNLFGDESKQKETPQKAQEQGIPRPKNKPTPSRRSSRNATPNHETRSSANTTPQSAFSATRGSNTSTPNTSNPTPQPTPRPKAKPRAKTKTATQEKSQSKPKTNSQTKPKDVPVGGRKFAVPRKPRYKEDHLSKADYIAKMKEYREKSLYYHNIREDNTNELEEMDKRAERIEISARKALEKAQMKYKEALNRSKALWDKASVFEKAANEADSKMEEYLTSYEKLQQKYGTQYGDVPDSSDEEF